MQKLTQFLKFDFDSFSKDKLYKVTSVSEWLDYDTKAHMGTKIGTVIIKDDTQYKQKDGESVSNLYEKVTFKIPADIKVPCGSLVVPVNAVGVVYGQYRNQLSVTADNIQILKPKATA